MRFIRFNFVVPAGLLSNSGTNNVQGSHTDTLVVLARLFSTSTPLMRALGAYSKLDLSSAPRRRTDRSIRKRAPRLSASQIRRLAERYLAGATVYELATEFDIDRHTVANRLKHAGVVMRRQPPTEATIDQMVHLYKTGHSLAHVGERVHVNATTVANHLRDRGIPMRLSGRRRVTEDSESTPTRLRISREPSAPVAAVPEHVFERVSSGSA